jgi:hypothetical protein
VTGDEAGTAKGKSKELGARVSLSRRDVMKVARQLLPGIGAKNGSRPVGYGMIGSDRRATISN